MDERHAPLCPNCLDHTCYRCKEGWLRMWECVELWSIPTENNETFESLYWKVKDEMRSRKAAK